jgi:ribosomal protein S18 acetylase RimI-like enzyme
VDPNFQGRRIASKLVTWGLERADKDHVPVYLESTPAAVRVYTRLGFKELKRLNVLNDNKSHILTVMIRAPNVIMEI